MYRWVVFLHVLSVFAFLLAHGTSAAMSLWLRRERQPERIRPLLELSGVSTGMWSNGAMLLILITGIAASLMAPWSQTGWIWASIILLIGIAAAMFFMGSVYYGRIRKAVGLPYMERGKEQPAVEPAPAGEIEALVNSPRATWLAAIGGVGIAIILWLMLFKPF